MKTNKNMYRQGDNLLVRTPKTKLPKLGSEIARSDGVLVIDTGSSSNNRHFIPERGAKLYATGKPLVRVLVVTGARVSLKHGNGSYEGHAKITLTKGSYRVIHQRELKRNEIVRVQD